MKKPAAKSWFTALMIFAAVGAVVYVGAGIYSRVQDAMVRAQVYGALKTIATALHQYHDKYGSYPPVTVNDDDGRAMHSWRTLIEPQIAARFAKPLRLPGYNMAKPWDDQANLKTSEPHPLTFAYRFFAVTGTDCAWSRTGTMTGEDSKRRSGNLALVIALKTDKYHWRQPVDVDIDEDGRPLLDGTPLDPNGEYAVLHCNAEIRHYFPGEFQDMLPSLSISKKADALAW